MRYLCVSHTEGGSNTRSLDAEGLDKDAGEALHAYIISQLLKHAPVRSTLKHAPVHSTLTNMATRPCLISASRRKFQLQTSQLPTPRGSKPCTRTQPRAFSLYIVKLIADTASSLAGRGAVCMKFHQSKNDKIVFHIGTTTGVLSRNGKNFNFVIIIGLHASGRGCWGASSWSVRIVPYLMVPVSRQTNIDCMQFLLGSLHLSFAQECRERDSGSRSPSPLEASCGPHQSY